MMGRKLSETNKNAILILSGGMDSTTLLYDIIQQGYHVKCLSFNYGQKHNRELDYAIRTTTKLGIEHKILDLSILNEVAPSALTRKEIEMPEGHYTDESMKQTVVPNRNMVLLSLATSYAIGVGYDNIFYGAHAGDHAIYPDCRKEFVKAMQNVIMISDWNPIKLYAPYLNIDKGQILRKGIKLGVDYNLTWTCYNPSNDFACGKCGSCQERLEAFNDNKIEDPLKYLIREIIKK
jgi:7-cyano-7-deazaguanine synthase